jgi:hypothetical protein
VIDFLVTHRLDLILFKRPGPRSAPSLRFSVPEPLWRRQSILRAVERQGEAAGRQAVRALRAAWLGHYVGPKRTRSQAGGLLRVARALHKKLPSSAPLSRNYDFKPRYYGARFAAVQPNGSYASIGSSELLTGRLIEPLLAAGKDSCHPAQEQPQNHWMSEVVAKRSRKEVRNERPIPASMRLVATRVQPPGYFLSRSSCSRTVSRIASRSRRHSAVDKWRTSCPVSFIWRAMTALVVPFAGVRIETLMSIAFEFSALLSIVNQTVLSSCACSKGSDDIHSAEVNY